MIPVPIDEIVELGLGLDLIATQNLTKDSGVPGFISRDLTTITVDLGVFEKRPFLCRKIIAHELAHSLLHRDFYSNISYSDVSGWLGVIRSISNTDLERLEWQADALGSLICVPKKELGRHVKTALQRATLNKEFNINKVNSKMLAKYIGSSLDKIFEVPAEVIVWRIEMDGLLPPDKLQEGA